MRYDEGDKVLFVPDNTIYDFGYYSQTPGKCVIYKEGERNMQDSYAVKIEDLKLADGPLTNKHNRTDIYSNGVKIGSQG